ncbi:MAG TPA: hypothetical protein VLF59_03320 [Candidatus Saccharimonadales bacterium]|nr:hypothetical protein [Candidatus Saccharimonadales bacterium]
MKTIIGLLPLILGVPSYAHYLYSVYKRKTVPHMYSWLIWAVLAGIGYTAQRSTHAGPGAWNTGFTAIVCFTVFLVSIRYGERRLSRLDLWLLGLAVIAIIMRLLSGNYVATTLLATIAASVGFVLTIKKAYRRPDQENLATFSINALRSLISLFALGAVTFTTFFYPFCMMLANAAVAATILIRKRPGSEKPQEP